jgi:hypothetical protein
VNTANTHASTAPDRRPGNTGNAAASVNSPAAKGARRAPRFASAAEASTHAIAKTSAVPAIPI